MEINWDIDPAGTRAVLVAASAGIDEQNRAATRMGSVIDDVAALVGRGLVGKALGDYVEMSLLPHLTAISGRSNRIIEGTADALVAYVQADFLMAQQAQASVAALAAEVSGLDGGGPLSRDGHRSPERG
ncbi:DUF6507 family protein [Paenarthrobacter sp. NPDC057981]|uniref:DUF6507 family protein n=1 Tax=Paenarthrobacter sp. NPDC057981 TaxID=3346297 RepID=UPI0036DA3E06